MNHTQPYIPGVRDGYYGTVFKEAHFGYGDSG